MSASYRSQHHSQTPPSMSNKPQSFGSFNCTERDVPPELSAYQAMWSSCPYRAPVVPARQAACHSASLGGRYPSAWWF